MAKTPRRLKGEGSIMQQANGTWRVQVRLPRPPGSTKRPSLVRTGIKRKADAAAVLDELRQQAKTVAAERQTVAGFLQWWLGGPCAELAPGTLDQYRLGVGHIVKAIGRMQLDQVKPADVDRVVESLDYAPTMRHQTYGVLRRALDVAVRREMIHRNPCLAVDCPSPKRERPDPFTAAEARLLIDETKGTRDHALLVLFLTTGPRQSEMFGLKKSRLDLKAGRMQIVEQLTDRRGKLSLRRPKTEASIRDVVLPSIAAEALVDHFSLLLREGIRSDYVFVSPDGTPIRRTNWGRRVWTPLLKRLGLRHRGAHQLRHTFATLALGAGIPLHVVSAILGHSRPSTTLDLYASCIPDQQAAAAADIHSLFAESVA